MTTTYRTPDTANTVSLMTTELNSLANATSAASTTERDNTTTRYAEAEIEVQLAAAAANTGFVDIYLIEGITTGDLSTYAQLQNARKIGSVQLNGTTTVQKKLPPFQGLGPFYKAVVYNGSGGALAASNNTVTLLGYRYTDA